MIKNNHFNTLRVKGQIKSTDFQKVKKKNYKNLLESKVEKSEKDHTLWVNFHIYTHKMHSMALNIIQRVKFILKK